jgi:hypothetical protein
VRCCGSECWSIWHPILKRGVAWACRKCDKLTLAPSLPEYERWAQCEWRRNKRVLEGKDDGARLVCDKPLTSRPARDITVIGDTKNCSKCLRRLPLPSFSIDRRECTASQIKYKAMCKECMVEQDRQRNKRRKELRDAGGKR